MTQDQLHKFTFKPISDGFKKAYYLNGQIYSARKIANSKESRLWEFWYSNGVKARVGEFSKGKPNASHQYWYDNGKLRGIGNWENGVYNGKRVLYSEGGKEPLHKFIMTAN